VKNDKIPSADHVLRYVARNRCRTDGNGNIIGCLPIAFEHRPASGNREAEEYLSVTWVEHFAGVPQAQIVAAVQAFRQAYFQDQAKGAGANSAFAKANVGQIHSVCETQRAKIRIVHHPSAQNPGHAAMRQVPRDNIDLLAILADEVFVDMILNSAIP
jgi:hypothetical protein